MSAGFAFSRAFVNRIHISDTNVKGRLGKHGRDNFNTDALIINDFEAATFVSDLLNKEHFRSFFASEVGFPRTLRFST